MPVQKDHYIPDLFLLFPGSQYLLAAFRANVGNFSQPFRVLVDDLDGFNTKMANNALRVCGTNAFEQSRSEVTAYTFQGHRACLLQMLNLELHSEFGVSRPVSAQLQEFSRR